jgi:anti-sigma regulatory factor (Ser/Thr protein kinase)/predicted ArsR family transcriptional regulator
VDWYVDTSDLESVGWLRAEVEQYLRRHATASSDVHGAVLVYSELATNAALYATGPLWVSIDWTTRRPVLSIHDLGPSFQLESIEMPDVDEVRGRGLAIAADIAHELRVRTKAGGGARVDAVLPVERIEEVSIDPHPRERGTLPDAGEAGPDGFGREAFLRALVVQLAQELERAHGPAAAQSAVAQVGTDIGARMEEEFREAAAIVGELTPEQVAACFVRLKHAIDGDFYVLEASRDRIVLGNRRCPFGDAVLQAPALCRMTSSVFGGIAARNFGQASVILEERIAVGDPQCRVVVDLRPEPESGGHVYAGSLSTGEQRPT